MLVFNNLISNMLNKLSRIPSRIHLSIANLAMSILYGRSLGWVSSAKQPSLALGHLFDSQLQPLPWFTYAAIAQLLRMDLRGDHVLEYGCGSSTVFFGHQGSKVTSIESNKDWHNYVRPSLSSASQVLLRTAKLDYVQTASQLAALNPSIIVVDGIERQECCVEIRDYIAHDSASERLWMIILDNSDWHASSYQILSSCDKYIGFDYYGHGPYNHYSWCTTLFLRVDALCLRTKFAAAGPAKPWLNGIPANFSLTS